MVLFWATKKTPLFGSDARLVIFMSDGYIVNRSATLKGLVEFSGFSVTSFIDAGLCIPTISPCSLRKPEH